ncbi:MAG: thioredoxin domain-containing protein [Agriterribacter sp.]
MTCYTGVAQKLNALTFKKSLDTISNKQIIDVRTPEEFGTGYIAGAKNINFYDADFKTRINELDKTLPVFVYCKAGVRSAEAAKLMRQEGFTNVYELEGGMMSWEKNQLPVSDEIHTQIKTTFSISDFDSLINNNPKLLIDFYAPWCIPCKQMEPSLEKLSKKYKDKVTFFRINLDEAKPLAQQLNIEVIPVVAVYNNGKETKRLTGLQSSSKLEALTKLVLKK